jgi:hypothetical protein
MGRLLALLFAAGNRRRKVNIAPAAARVIARGRVPRLLDRAAAPH